MHLPHRIAPLLLLAALLVPRPALARKLYPVDEGRRNPSFHAFRQRFVKALRTGDRPAILAVVAPQIENGFGAGPGMTEFRQVWSLDDPDGRGWLRLRTTLLEALSRGGSFKDRAFWAPYVYSRWPEDVDGYFLVCVLGRKVAAHSRPDPSSPVVAHLSHDIVKVTSQQGFQGTEPWVPILTPNGRRAYVPGHSLASPLDYRISFERVKGVWKLTGIYSGD